MVQSQKRAVRAKAQKIKIPRGLTEFVNQIHVGTEAVYSAQIVKNLPNVERYVYKWESVFQLVDFPTSANRLKKCYWVKASVEYPRNKRTDSDGKLLERDRRVNINDVTVLLVEDTDIESYLIVVSSYKPDVGRIDYLVGSEKVHELEMEDLIPSDFFVWLYYSYNRHEEVLPDLNLNNIVGFTGIIADDTNQIVGSSINIPDLIITKAFVSNGYDLKSLRLDLSDTVLTTISALNEDRSLVMDLPRTELNFDGQSERDWFYKMVRATSYIYAGLLPALLEQYSQKQQAFVTENKSFSKEIGIEVVQAIVKHNQIKSSEINFNLG